MKSFVAILLLACIPFAAVAATIQVPGDYTTIQSAIENAVQGDTVIVAPGTYVENLDFLGKAITVQSSHGPHVTTIDGSNPVDPNFGSVVHFHGNEGLDSVIQGFTLTRGLGTVDPILGTVGGGVRCDGASPSIIGNIVTDNHAAWTGGINCWPNSSALIKDNVISYNTSTELDGAIECFGQSHAVITGNLFLANSSTNVGGIYCGDRSDPIMTDNLFIGNTTPNNGGALEFASNCSPVLINNVFQDNFAGKNGGAILSGAGCTLEMKNNLFINNTAGNNGGAVVISSSTLTSENDTFRGNTAANKGGALHCKLNGNSTVINAILWNDTSVAGKEIRLDNNSRVTIEYSDLEGGQASVEVGTGCTLDWGSGMIDADPLFVDTDDLHLTFLSPCRDAGGMSTALDDFEGDPRIGTADMGADEFHVHLYCTGDATPGGSIAGKFVGDPGTAPVGLFLGAELLDPPMPTLWGAFHIKPPYVLLAPLGAISSNGLLILPATLPATIPAPYDLPMQAMIGSKFTNLCILEVR